MAKVVYAAALSHTAQMVRSVSLLTDKQRDIIYQGISRLHDELKAAKPDVIVIFGGDHYASFFLDAMPTFCIGINEDKFETWGDGGIPVYEIPAHPAFSHELAEKLFERAYDLVTSRRMRLDHAFACPLHFLSPSMDIPIAPILINTIAPPLAPPVRSYQFGQAVGEIIRESQSVDRVALIGTGGLSHSLPIPHPDEVIPKEDAELRMQMIDGRADPARLSKLLISRLDRATDSGGIRFNEAFDKEVIELLRNGRAEELAAKGSEWIAEHGGNGGQEIRNWIAVAAASQNAKAELVAYEPVEPWLSGIACMNWLIDTNKEFRAA